MNLIHQNAIFVIFHVQKTAFRGHQYLQNGKESYLHEFIQHFRYLIFDVVTGELPHGTPRKSQQQRKKQNKNKKILQTAIFKNFLYEKTAYPGSQ